MDVIHGTGEHYKGMHYSMYKQLIKGYEQLTAKLMSAYDETI